MYKHFTHTELLKIFFTNTRFFIPQAEESKPAPWRPWEPDEWGMLVGCFSCEGFSAFQIILYAWLRLKAEPHSVF